jgi:hypothetical protein
MMGEGTERKRKRPTTTTTTSMDGTVFVQLPTIPGVPTESIPRFLESLRVTAKFYQRLTNQQYTIVDWENRNNADPTTSASGVASGASSSTINHSAAISSTRPGAIVDTIMNRLEAADAVSVNDTAVLSEERRIRQDMKRAVEVWIEDVKVRARRDASRTSLPRSSSTRSTSCPGLYPSIEETATTSNNVIQHQDQAKEMPSIPYSLFTYLWEMQQHHDRVPVRRSALLLSSLLLQKSKFCRLHLEQESHIADWVTNIVAERRVWKDPNKATLHLPLLQGEAISLLSYLLDNGYGRVYPKIGVAYTSLRHQCPNLDVVPMSGIGGMATWRKFRDIALLYGEKEIERVDKLLQRANRYLEVLVPRVGIIGNDTETTTTTFLTDRKPQQSGHDSDDVDKDNENNDADEEESDVDWEDGDGLEENGGAMFGGRTNQAMHISAVDKTMAAMESAGTILLRGGELEIEFGAQTCDGNYSNTITDDGDDNGPPRTVLDPKVRKNLEKCIQKLSRNHLPRLTAWLEGLRNADILVMTSSSLVSMSSESRKQRLDLVERLSEVKQQIANTLSSASRLNLDVTKLQQQQQQQQQRDATDPSPRIIAPRMLGDNAHGRFGHLLGQKQKKKKAGTGRIQIKCPSR